MGIYEEIIASLFADNLEKFFHENEELIRKLLNDSMSEMVLQIKALLEDDQVSDFNAIEEIIEIFQLRNIPISFRHEFI